MCFWRTSFQSEEAAFHTHKRAVFQRPHDLNNKMHKLCSSRITNPGWRAKSWCRRTPAISSTTGHLLSFFSWGRFLGSRVIVENNKHTSLWFQSNVAKVVLWPLLQSHCRPAAIILLVSTFKSCQTNTEMAGRFRFFLIHNYLAFLVMRCLMTFEHFSHSWNECYLKSVKKGVKVPL